MVDILYVRTKDDLRLQGIHFDGGKRDICVLMVHGMAGNFMENYSAKVSGDKLSEAGIGFIYGHNRGYNEVNDIFKESENTTERYGAIYERFNDCLLDIDVWLEECKQLGYKRIVLLGHSLGCNKVIHYFSEKKPQEAIGVILASPPDMVGLFEKPEYQPNHKELLEEARNNVKEGNPRKLVSGLVWDSIYLSSQTYLDLSERGGPADNLPVLRNPDHFEELESINVPILGLMGEYDDITIRTLQEDLDLIASKATNTPSFDKKFIEGANHSYDNQEESFSNVVLDWIKSKFDKK